MALRLAASGTSGSNVLPSLLGARQLDEAVPLFEQTLADRERVLGQVHPGTLISRDNLAIAYKDARQLDETGG